MMRRFLLTSALILVASAAVSESAFAQTVDIPFTGNVPGSCSFGTATGGTLGVNTTSSPTALGGGYPGGVFGKVSVTCSQASKLTVSAPVKNSGPDFTPSTITGYVNASSSSTSSASGSTPLALTSGTAIPLSVDMMVSNGSTPLPAGIYNYKVTLTVTQ